MKLGLNGFGNFFGRMGIDVIHAFLEGVGEFLDYIRVGLKVALFCTIGRIGHIAGIGAQGSDNVAVAFQFQAGCKGFKFNCVIRIVTGKGGGGKAEANALVNGQVGFVVNAVFL